MRRILLAFGITVIGALIGMFVVPVLLSITLVALDKFLLKNTLDPTIPISTTIFWGPVLGIFIGASVGLRFFCLLTRK